MLKKFLIVFFVSMVPLIELRGAIPYAIGFGLPLFPSYIVAIIGNMIPVPFIFFFAHRLLLWGKDLKIKPLAKFCNFCINKGEKGKEKLLSKYKQNVYIALMLFVGIPLPGTGAWTGTLAASLLDLDFKKSVIAVILGVILAGIIMGLVTVVFKGTINIFRWGALWKF